MVFIICTLLVISTIYIYGDVRRHDFINLDDPAYLTENKNVSSGLTLKSVMWAFTSVETGYWFPLTWLSHMIDVQLYGMNPGGHHFTNLMFHVANVLLLFTVLRTMTRATWPSALVAALFACHPVHVESVAWAAERKDVLSTFFFLISIRFYIRAVDRRTPKIWWFVFGTYVCGLMAKPMVVTLPVLLILLDYWPLQRMGNFQQNPCKISHPHARPASLFLEKLPLLTAAMLVGGLTLILQQHVGAVRTLGDMPLGLRVMNMVCSYINYLFKLIMPVNLSVFYPYPTSIPWVKAVISCIFLTAMTVAAIQFRRRAPYLFVGWLWFVMAMMPVIGILQSGYQAMADRFAYIPFIGIYIIIAWSLWEAAGRMTAPIKKVLVPVLVITLATMAIQTKQQVAHWAGSIPLYRHALAVTDDNFILHANLGVVLARQGRLEEAIWHYRKAIHLQPDYIQARLNLSSAYLSMGDTERALQETKAVLEKVPNHARVHNYLALGLIQRGDIEAAIQAFQTAVTLDGNEWESRKNLKLALSVWHPLQHAIRSMQAAMERVRQSPIPSATQLITLDSAKTELIHALAVYQKTIVRLSSRNHIQNPLNQPNPLKEIWQMYEQLLPSVEAHFREGSEQATAAYHVACIYALKNDVKNVLDWLKKAVALGYDNLDLIQHDFKGIAMGLEDVNTAIVDESQK